MVARIGLMNKAVEAQEEQSEEASEEEINEEDNG